jgi:AcrR family transcriptional regulator
MTLPPVLAGLEQQTYCYHHTKSHPRMPLTAEGDNLAADTLPAGVVAHYTLPDHSSTDARCQLPGRQERRKQRTRAALIRAAQGFIATGKPNVSVLEITRAADVGMGSFYNHFDTKEQLFQAALQDIFEVRGVLLDGLPAVEDPAETFARKFRVIGRMFRRRPQESLVLLNVGLGSLVSERSLPPRALRDIKTAHRAGRFQVADPELAVTLATGALLGLNQLLLEQPERDDAEATDHLAENLLRVYGVPADEAQEMCRRLLPELDHLAVHDVFGVQGCYADSGTAPGIGGPAGSFGSRGVRTW